MADNNSCADIKPPKMPPSLYYQCVRCVKSLFVRINNSKWDRNEMLSMPQNVFVDLYFTVSPCILHRPYAVWFHCQRNSWICVSFMLKCHLTLLIMLTFEFSSLKHFGRIETMATISRNVAQSSVQIFITHVQFIILSLFISVFIVICSCPWRAPEYLYTFPFR